MFTIKSRIDVEKIINKRITPELKTYVNTRLYAYCDEYVPFLNGPLSQNVRISDEGIHYVMKYGYDQYTNLSYHHTITHHPKATAYWDRAMVIDKIDPFCKDIENALRSGKFERHY